MVGARLKAALGPALLLSALSAPAQPAQPPAAAPAARFSAPSATVTLDATCAVRLDGRALSQEALLERSVVLIRARIESAGGPQAIDERNMPLLRLEAASDAPWSCLEPTLHTLERAGFAVVALRPAQAAGSADAFAFFLQPGFDGDISPAAVLRVGPEDALSWNGTTIAPAELDAHLAGLGRARAQGAEAPPNQFVLVPDAATRFGALLAFIDRAARRGVDTTVARCAGRAGVLAESCAPAAGSANSD